MSLRLDSPSLDCTVRYGLLHTAPTPCALGFIISKPVFHIFFCRFHFSFISSFLFASAMSLPVGSDRSSLGCSVYVGIADFDAPSEWVRNIRHFGSPSAFCGGDLHRGRIGYLLFFVPSFLFFLFFAFVSTVDSGFRKLNLDALGCFTLLFSPFPSELADVYFCF